MKEPEVPLGWHFYRAVFKAGHMAWIFAVMLLGTVQPAGGFDVPTAGRVLDARGELQQALNDFEQAQQLLTADGPQARKLFAAAAKRFENLSASGVVNGRLEFNIGNAYLQADDLGRAMLHYRRAERLIPRDPLLADNLAEAKKRCLINIAPTGRSVFLRNLLFWHYQTSFAERATLALIAYALFWIVLTVRNLAPRLSINVACLLLGGLAVGLASSLAVEQWNDRRAPAGVVTAMDVVVFKGPGTGYQRLFEQPLQPGVEFILRERRAGWWNVELPDGRAGWINESAASTVPREETLH